MAGKKFSGYQIRGWQGQPSYIQHPDRAARLLLILALAYTWMLALGTQITRSLAKPDRYSVFLHGLRYFKYLTLCGLDPLIPVQLDFTPLCC